MHYLILGLGKSGIAAAKHVLHRNFDCTVYAGASNENVLKCARKLTELGARIIFDDEDVKGHYDVCIVCPGIPQTGSFYKKAQAASDELISEPEYAYRNSKQEWIAVTGTNGKTTTTALIAHLIKACGKTSFACGNIGDTTIEAVENCSEDEVLVAELSSYQLASIAQFCPRTAILLNITPDHISWHGSFEAYAQAKLRVFENMQEGSSVLLPLAFEGRQSLIPKLRQRGVSIIEIGTDAEKDCAYEKDGTLFIKRDGKTEEICNVHDLKIKGNHNVQNALFAAAFSLDYGFKVEDIAKGLRSFEALEHRIEPVDIIDGVEFFNDSKGTNVDATLQALTAFPNQRILLMLGGRDKGTSLDELVKACEDTCACVLCYGEAGPRFFEAFKNSSLASSLHSGMKDAFESACSKAREGDVVLLSPACASFDEFNSFGHRGDTFKQWVAEKKKSM